MNQTIFSDLTALLEFQKQGFSHILSMQEGLRKALDAEKKDFPAILQQLSEKDALLDLIRKRSDEAESLIEEWKKNRSEYQADDRYEPLAQLLEEVEALIEQMKQQDEEMMLIFQKMASQAEAAENPKNRMNAFRAMR